MRQGEKYGTMAVDLSLVHISMAASEDAMQDHITDLARTTREHVAQQAGAEPAAVWKEASLKAVQARLEASGGPEEVK